MKHEDLIDLIRLTRTDGVGPKSIRAALDRFGAISEAIAQWHQWSRGRALVSIPTAEAEFVAASKLGFTYLGWDDPLYPEPLRAIEDAPPVLVVKGSTSVLAKPMIAMVGARNATLNGKRFAKLLAHDLAKAGAVVISGMARGIDGAAHEGALAARGETVAVLAGGTDVVYPPEHRDLYERIAAAGAVISEMPPGTQPQAALFPRRNRIISGASQAVAVVEATLKSGSLITARMAADQGREVFAVPGSPLDPRAQGPNGLIRDGATLIQSAGDVLAALPSLTRDFLKSPPQSAQPIEIPKSIPRSAVRRAVEAALSSTPAPVDELVRQCQVSPAVLAEVLLELELAGRLERLPGNRVALLSDTGRI
ncbi:MAG: DNA-processing protein DprA [Rhodospirillaceae bacterium]|nr:DNA-processing protein DprA [Rhodospirillaceae bacterium]